VQLLLEYGADIAAKTATGSTALHEAACNGWEACCSRREQTSE
jgi:ankyrin repeat protein